jgi:hypothetical protein
MMCEYKGYFVEFKCSKDENSLRRCVINRTRGYSPLFMTIIKNPAGF